MLPWRRAGVRVSTAETLDALQALRHVPWDNPVVVREGLRATLVKRAADQSHFDTLFDRAFLQLAGSPGEAFAAWQQALTAEARAALQAAQAVAPRDAAALIAALLADSPAALVQLLQAASAKQRPLQGPWQAGIGSLRVFDAVGGGGPPGDSGDAAGLVREQALAQVRATIAPRHAANLAALRREQTLERSIFTLTSEEYAEVEQAVHALMIGHKSAHRQTGRDRLLEPIYSQILLEGSLRANSLVDWL